MQQFISQQQNQQQPPIIQIQQHRQSNNKNNLNSSNTKNGSGSNSSGSMMRMSDPSNSPSNSNSNTYPAFTPPPPPAPNSNPNSNPNPNPNRATNNPNLNAPHLISSRPQNQFTKKATKKLEKKPNVAHKIKVGEATGNIDPRTGPKRRKSPTINVAGGTNFVNKGINYVSNLASNAIDKLLATSQENYEAMMDNDYFDRFVTPSLAPSPPTGRVMIKLSLYDSHQLKLQLFTNPSVFGMGIMGGDDVPTFRINHSKIVDIKEITNLRTTLKKACRDAPDQPPLSHPMSFNVEEQVSERS